ncbi:MAG: hypothetical protein ABJF04_16220 [Reichenbachiella sp.]|uniref:hypothetical protein n=1 Tax=Reichenbachiella sp. TaxID=2184521 RepID=UPI0032643986
MKNTFSLLEEFQNDPQAFVWRQIREAQKFKKAGFPIEVPLHQEELDDKSFKLRSNSHFYKKLEENSFKQKKAQFESDDIKSRYEYFVSCQKLTLSDRLFASIDKLLARLTSLKSRAKEMKTYMNTKNE